MVERVLRHVPAELVPIYRSVCPEWRAILSSGHVQPVTCDELALDICEAGHYDLFMWLQKMYPTCRRSGWPLVSAAARGGNVALFHHTDVMPVAAFIAKDMDVSAVHSGNIDMLTAVYDASYPPGVHAMIAASASGRMDMCEMISGRSGYGHAKLMLPGEVSCNAARLGHRDMLTWLASAHHECVGSHTTATLAATGSLETMRWWMTQDAYVAIKPFEWGLVFVGKRPASDTLAMLKLLHEHGQPDMTSADMTLHVARVGDIVLFDWIMGLGAATPHIASMSACASRGHATLLAHIHRKYGVNLGRAATVAARRGHVNVLEMIHALPDAQVWTAPVYGAMARSGDMTMLRWFHAQICRGEDSHALWRSFARNSRVLGMSIRNAHYEAAHFMLDHGVLGSKHALMASLRRDRPKLLARMWDLVNRDTWQPALVFHALDCLRVLKDSTIPRPGPCHAVMYGIASNRVAVLDMLYDEMALRPCTGHAHDYYRHAQSLGVMQWLYSHDFTMEGPTHAYESCVDADILSWLHEKGFVGMSATLTLRATVTCSYELLERALALGCDIDMEVCLQELAARTGFIGYAETLRVLQAHV